MSVLTISDVFAAVKDWFVQLPDLISGNVWILFAIIAFAVVIVALVVTLIVVSVKKSKTKRKISANTTAEQLPVQQPVGAEEEVAEVQPVEEIAERIIKEEPAAEVAATAVWEEAPVAEEIAASPAEVQAPVAVEIPVPAEEVAAVQPAEEPAPAPAAKAPAKERKAKPAAKAGAAPAAAQPATTPVDGQAATAPAAEQAPLPAGATVRTVEEEGWYVRTLYNRSFMAKLIQSDQAVKDFYSVLKNELLAYGTAARVSWKHESFRVGRNTRAKFVIRGKTLCLCLALDANDFAASKYLVDDMSKYASYAATPLLYRIKNARRCRYAVELIAGLFGAENRAERGAEDFSAIPYRETLPLVEEGLIKIVRTESVRLAEGQAPVAEMFVADEDDEGFEDDIEELDEVEASAVSSLMGDEYAKSLLAESSVYSDKTRQCIVNIEVLGRFFEDGETVTLEELKKRVPIIDKRATYIKVLARGRLNKALVVIADDFSLEAVKMIALTGGRAVRNKRK